MAQKSVLIIGGTSSCAPSLIQAFIEDGWRVLATHRPGRAPTGADVHPVPLDLADTDSIAGLAEHLADEDLSCVVFLAGVINADALADLDAQKTQTLIEVNLSGQMLAAKALLPCLADDALYLFVSSIAGQRGSFDAAYAASKAGIIGFAKSLAVAKPVQPRAVVVAPGLIAESNMCAGMDPARVEFHQNAVPLKTLLTPDELAAVVVNLTQPHWRHANGAVISLNGGQYV